MKLIPELKIFKLYPDVEIPKFGTTESACFDLKACIRLNSTIRGFDGYNIPISIPVCNMNPDSIEIMPQDRLLIPTGIIFKIPTGYSLRIHPRSGVAYKQGLVLANQESVIDSDYYHETFILITNKSKVKQRINNGDKLVQAELIKSLDYEILETQIKPEKTTNRIGGLGSTGK